MGENILGLEKRVESGKKAKKLRAEGLVPGVVYGGKEEILTKSGYNETEKILRAAGYHSPVELEIDGKKQLAMVKSVGVDPVKRRIVSVAFQAVSANEKVTAVTPIVLVGAEESEAEKKHLSILQVIEEIEVKAKPAELPEKIEISVAGFAEIGDKVTLADLQLPKGVEFADKELDLEDAVANVYDAAAERAKADAEAAEEEKPAEGAENAEESAGEAGAAEAEKA